jgi:hypothetical protein
MVTKSPHCIKKERMFLRVLGTLSGWIAQLLPFVGVLLGKFVRRSKISVICFFCHVSTNLMTVRSATLVVGAAAFEVFFPLLYYPTLQDQPPHTKAVNSLSRSVPNVTCCMSTSVLGRGSFFEICLSHEAEGLMAGEGRGGGSCSGGVVNVQQFPHNRLVKLGSACVLTAYA